jgi:hypothetical protein
MARLGSRFPPEPAAGAGREAEKDTGETTNSADVTAREKKKEPSVSSEQWKPRRLQLPYRRTPARNRAKGQGQVMDRNGNEDEARAYTWHTYLLSTSISVIVMHAQASIGPPL